VAVTPAGWPSIDEEPPAEGPIPSAPKYLPPISREEVDAITQQFEGMKEGRVLLDDELMAEETQPNDISRFSLREQLLQMADRLLKTERLFLRRRSLELERREQLLK
jgi:hypothetical protein